MIDKTTGIVLRVSPYSRTSHIVMWLTQDFGKIATLIKGAQRPKSLFLGQYDLYYTCDLLFYSHDRSGVHIIRECSPIETRRQLRSDWKASACASYFCDFTSRMLPTHAASPAFFELLDTSLDHLCSGFSPGSFISWFELRALAAAGLSPRLDRCLVCGTTHLSTNDKLLFSYSRGGLLCETCASSSGERPIAASEEVFSVMRELQATDRAEEVDTSKCSTKRLLQIGRMLGLFIGYHAPAMPPSRSIVMDML